MNCRRARQLLFDFFDGASNEALRAEVDRHLGECTDCEHYAAEMSRCLALLRLTPVEPLDDTFNWKVKLAIHRERNAAMSRAHSAGTWVRMWNVRYALSGGLAFGAVLVAGALLLRDGNVVAPRQLTMPATEVAQKAEPTRPTTTANHTQLPVPGRRDNLGFVSTGGASEFHGPAPQGPIDQTEAESHIDSLISSDVMRMSARDRELYIQRRLENIERIRQYLQSQQAAPAQR